MEKNGQRSRRLVLLPCPFQGHINPMLQLGTILHSKGFSITITHTEFNSPNPSNHPNFKFLPIPDGLSRENSLSNANCYYKVFCSLLPTSSHMCIYIYGQDLDSVSQDLVPNHHPLRFKDLPFPSSRKLESFSQLVIDTYKIKTSSSAIIWNTMDCLELSSLARIQQQYQVPNLPIGPLHKFGPGPPNSSLLKEDTSCVAWLGKQTKNSVIYVSLGSIAAMDERELFEMAWGLANSEQRFLWEFRPASIRGSKNEVLSQIFKETIGERGCIVNWAPQKEVLAHSAVGGFLSHCGWNSTLESICEGIPMICRPCFGDQRMNARYVSHVWRVGLELASELERGEIEKAIRRLMAGKEGEAMRERAKNLKEKFELCIKEGGSSNNSLNKLVKMIMSF
ncbi:hypothetical protein ACB098_08G056900 [Castanea mollissima]